MAIAADLVRTYGLKKFTFEFLPWNFSRKFVIYSMQLAPRVLAPGVVDSLRDIKQSCPTDFRLALADQSDLAHIMAARPHFYTEKQLEKRFQAGHMCFLGWVNNDPVHLRWHFVHSIHLPYIKRDLLLSEHQVWADEGYTKPAYRHSGIFSNAGSLINTTLVDMNYKTLLCAFASWNKTPQRIDSERGMKPVGEVLFRNYTFRHTYRLSGSVKEGEGNSIEIEEQTLENLNEK